MHLDTNFVVAKRHERTLDYPEVFQSASFDLCDEICLLIRRTHRGLHAAAATGVTLRRGARAKNPPGVDATFHGGKLAAAPLRRFSCCETVHWRPTLVPARRLAQSLGHAVHLAMQGPVNAR